MRERIKEIIEREGMGQSQFADFIGVSQQSVNKYENHNIEPDIEMMIRIADYFNTSVDYLIGHTDVRRKIEITHAYKLNADESTIIESYRTLSNKQKHCIATVIKSYKA